MPIKASATHSTQASVTVTVACAYVAWWYMPQLLCGTRTNRLSANSHSMPKHLKSEITLLLKTHTHTHTHNL